MKIALIAAALAVTCAGPELAAAPRPNVVLIVADDHGIDALGCYGNPVVQTPHLDRLAEEGTRYTRAFATVASCSPSRSVILTGQHSHRNGMYGLEHQHHHFSSFSSLKSLPVRLAEAGYRTARVGKFHVAPESVYRFETILSAGSANDPSSVGRSPVEMADATADFIASNDDRPFFLYFATDDPHRSNVVLADGRPSFESYPQPNAFGNRPSGYPDIRTVEYSPDEVIVPPYLPDTPESRAELAQYYQAVSRVDQGVGRLLQILRDTGHYDNTFILYLSDNGAAFPGAKTTLYEPGIRLPLITKTPGQPAASAVSSTMLSWTDIAPTVLDVAEVSYGSTDFDGHSFQMALAGATLEHPKEIYAAHNLHEITMYYPMRAVRTDRYKLIYNIAHGLRFPLALDLVSSPTWIGVKERHLKTYGQRSIDSFLDRPEWELYDLAADPNEVTNLADNPRHSSTLRELKEKLRSFQKATNDPWVHKWIYE